MIINRLLLNLSTLGENPTGIGRYLQYCAACIEKNFNCDILASYYQSNQGNMVIQSPRNIVIGGGKLSALRRVHYSYKNFPKSDAFIFTPTHHGVFGWSNQVITIHDLISIHHPFQHKFQYAYFRWLLPKIMTHCRAVFVVSETTKYDLCNYYSFNQENVYVVPNGVDTEHFCPVDAKRPIGNKEEPFLLCIGAFYSHKNVDELLLNWRLWKSKYKIKIVSAGNQYEIVLRNLVKDLNLSADVTFIEYVSENDLITLYRSCTALVSPSLWEGFGLTPLEAMACGSPVIISDIPVHKEIFGDSAIYITPEKRNTWSAALEMLKDNKIISHKMKVAQGVVKQYSWKASCEILVDSLLNVEPNLARFKKNSVSKRKSKK